MSIRIFILFFAVLSASFCMEAGNIRTKILPKTVIVTQTPRHSTLGDREDYMGRFSDYPLMMDPRWNHDAMTVARTPYQDFLMQQKYAESYLIDGFAIFPGIYMCLGFLEYAQHSPSKMLELPIINLWYNEAKDFEAVQMALKNSKQYRYKGKILLLSYWTQRYFTPEKLDAKLKQMRAKFGDTFWFVPDVMRLAYFQHDMKKNGGKLPEKKVREIEETLRKYLRVADGLYFGETHMLHKVDHMERVFDTEYYRDFVIAVMRKVLEEPEFKGKKFLALSAINGHENNLGLGYQCSHNGTRTLRDSFQCVLDANPDVIMLPEWDESNENTCFRPTIYNGFVTKRIVRYFVSKLNHLPLRVIPGDDTSIPNLAVSYRKTLALGERLTIEVLNIPDGSFRNQAECSIELLSPEGKTVKKFKPQKLSANRLAEIRFHIGSEELAAERALQVVLNVRWNGKNHRYTGFTPIELRTGSTYDFRWAKHGLRDLLPVKHAKISNQGNKFTVDFESSVPLRAADLNLNGDIVYSDDPAGDVRRFREDDKYAVFSLSLIRKDGKSKVFKNAWLSVTGSNDCEWQYSADKPIKGNRYPFHWISQSSYKHFLRIPVKDADKAKLHFDLPGVYQGSIDLATVRKEGIYSICGEDGLQLSVSRFMRQAHMPAVLNRTKTSFTVEVPSDIVNRTVFFHAVGMNGQLWRSRPFVLEKKSKPSEIRVYSADKNKVVKAAVPANRLLKLEYDFSPKAGGTIKPLNNDRSYYGALGTPFCIMVLRHRGTGTFGDPLKFVPSVLKIKNTVPKQIKLPEGFFALDFKNQYAAFPQDLIPTHSSYIIRMEVFPRDIQRKQCLIATRCGTSPGSLYGIFINPKGWVHAEFAGLNAEHTSMRATLQVKPNQWNKIEFRYFVDSMELLVNGKSSGRVPCCYPGRYVTPVALGAVPDAFFDGMIRNFSVDHNSR